MQNWQKAEDIIYDYFSSKKDSYIIRQKDTHDINAQLRRFGEKPLILVKKKESDFIVIDNGDMYFAEVKCTGNIRGLTSALFSRQEGKRNRILRANGKYNYFVFSEFRDQWYKIPGSVVAEKKNLRWEDIISYKINYLESVL